MMTPTRIVRFLGFVGLAVFFGLVATSTSKIQAQNDDQIPPPPPIATQPKPVIVSQATDEPLPAIATDPKQAVEPLPLPAAAPEKPKAPIAEPAPDSAPIPRAPESAGLEAATINTEPQPIGEAVTNLPDDSEPVQATTTVTIADEPAPAAFAASADNDPDAQARSFVERSRKEAENQLKALNSEAAQLRARLNKIDSGIRRWQALVDAMDRTEEAAASRGDDLLEPLPHARPAAAQRRTGKTAVIHSTPEDPVTRAQYVPAPLPR